MYLFYLNLKNHFIWLFIKEHTSNYINLEGKLCGFITVPCVCDASVTLISLVLFCDVEDCHGNYELATIVCK